MTFTPQELFTRAYLGVINQGGFSRTNSGYDMGACKYRGPNNRKCAVGHLIDDDIARAWDSRSNSRLSEIKATERYPIPQHILQNLELLQDMQTAHDTSATIPDFQYKMEELARTHHLEMPKND